MDHNVIRSVSVQSMSRNMHSLGVSHVNRTELVIVNNGLGLLLGILSFLATCAALSVDIGSMIAHTLAMTICAGLFEETFRQLAVFDKNK